MAGQADALALRDNAKYHLMQISSVETGIDYLKKVDGFAALLKAEKIDTEIQNIVVETRVRTWRLLGQLIHEGKKAGSIAKAGGNRIVPNKNNGEKKLWELGVSRKQSSNFQKVYSIPEEDFEGALAKNKTAEDGAITELTTSAILRVANKLSPNEAQKRERQPSFDFKKLVRIRTDFQISQYQLALECNIEASCVSRLETGELEWPYFDTIARIAGYFKVPMEYFLINPLP